MSTKRMNETKSRRLVSDVFLPSLSEQSNLTTQSLNERRTLDTTK